MNGETPLVADTVIEHGMAADLVIASQVDRSDSFGVELDFVERLVMGLGRPLLLVPNATTSRTLRGKVLIGWNGTREAARAAFDAIPSYNKRKLSPSPGLTLRKRWRLRALFHVPIGDGLDPP